MHFGRKQGLRVATSCVLRVGMLNARISVVTSPNRLQPGSEKACHIGRVRIRIDSVDRCRFSNVSELRARPCDALPQVPVLRVTSESNVEASGVHHDRSPDQATVQHECWSDCQNVEKITDRWTELFSEEFSTSPDANPAAVNSPNMGAGNRHTQAIDRDGSRR